MTTPDDHSPDGSPMSPCASCVCGASNLLRLTELVCYAVQTVVGERDGNTISRLFSFDTSSFPITQVAAKWTYVTYIRPFVTFTCHSSHFCYRPSQKCCPYQTDSLSLHADGRVRLTHPSLYAMAGGHGEGDACIYDPFTASIKQKEYDEEDFYDSLLYGLPHHNGGTGPEQGESRQ